MLYKYKLKWPKKHQKASKKSKNREEKYKEKDRFICAFGFENSRTTYLTKIKKK